MRLCEVWGRRSLRNLQVEDFDDTEVTSCSFAVWNELVLGFATEVVISSGTLRMLFAFSRPFTWVCLACPECPASKLIGLGKLWSCIKPGEFLALIKAVGRAVGIVSRLKGVAQLTAEEATLVKTPSIALDFLGMVDCLVTGTAFGSASPVWHPWIWRVT